MNKKAVSAVIGIGVVALAALAAYTAPRPAPRSSQQQSSTSTPAAKPVAAYSLAHVAAHKDAASCWVVVNGVVYDLTAWIAQHPGGTQAILGLCGKDASAAFAKQHGGSENAQRALAQFNIGTLVK